MLANFGFSYTCLSENVFMKFKDNTVPSIFVRSVFLRTHMWLMGNNCRKEAGVCGNRRCTVFISTAQKEDELEEGAAGWKHERWFCSGQWRLPTVFPVLNTGYGREAISFSFKTPFRSNNPHGAFPAEWGNSNHCWWLCSCSAFYTHSSTKPDQAKALTAQEERNVSTQWVCESDLGEESLLDALTWPLRKETRASTEGAEDTE